MKEALKHYINAEIENLKNHLFGVISVFVKFILPLVFVFAQSVVKDSTRSRIETWAILPLGFLLIVYYKAIRRAFNNKKTEENIVTRIDSKKAEPLRLVLFCFLDDCIMSPILPLICYLLSKQLEELAIKNSTAMLAIFVLFLVGGVLKLIDYLLNMTRIFKENYPDEATSKEESENVGNGTTIQ